jgi:hypothetical protein
MEYEKDLSEVKEPMPSVAKEMPVTASSKAITEELIETIDQKYRATCSRMGHLYFDSRVNKYDIFGHEEMRSLVTRCYALNETLKKLKND